VTDPVGPLSVATHDAVLLDRVVRRLRAAGIDCEIELLLGLPARRPLAVAARHAVPVRFYLAYGHPSLVYSPGAVLRRTRLALPLAAGVSLGSWNQRLRVREALRHAATIPGTAVPPSSPS
jgi:proline dehydrogenase